MAAATVKAFNTLERPENSPSGLTRSHWHFSVRHVPFNPPSDLLMIVNPESRFMHNAGPAKILAAPTIAAQADIIAPLLLEAFVTGVNKGPNGEQLNDLPLFAPWTWGTTSEELAKAVEAKLKELKVRPELCIVQSENKKDDSIADEVWDNFFRELARSMGVKLAPPLPGNMDPIKCSGCKHGSSSFPHPLRKCSGCKTTLYCSTKCQKKDWKNHKKICTPPPVEEPKIEMPASAFPSIPTTPGAGMEETGSLRKMQVVNYWMNTAKTVPEAVELAKSINLPIDGPNGPAKGYNTPIRRLIITGKDTPENFALLLGPGWKDQLSHIEEVRLGILMHAAPGSPEYIMSQYFDKDAPSKTPRPATPEEEEKLKKVRDMQDLIRKNMADGAATTKSALMAKILSSFGGEWVEMMPLYTMAFNTMVEEPPAA